MNHPLYPLTFDPIYQTYIWGGRQLADVYGRSIPGEPCAESWELSDRPDGMSIVREGPLVGTSFRTLIETRAVELFGHEPPPVFPLLIKILDAKTTLSVQVHPNDVTAASRGGEAKSELWYVLSAEPGAKVYCGLKPGCTETSLRAAIEQEQLEDFLEVIEVTKGNVINVPGGCVHAIASGCLLLEVQQNSNTTYRLYDWNRRGPDGQPRALHIDQAMEVIDWESADCGKVAVKADASRCTKLLSTPYFTLERLDLSDPVDFQTQGRWHILFVESGQLHIDDTVLNAGQTCLIPACLASVRLEGTSQLPARVIRIFQ
ncbi:MAG: mannose-6-phosphate isomerase [Kiritimatiellia bacterium]|jgi:mannose-6-phosphate isomerase